MAKTNHKLFSLTMLATGYAVAFASLPVAFADEPLAQPLSVVAISSEPITGGSSSVVELIKIPAVEAELQPLSSTYGLTLAVVEEMALANHPSIAQAEASVRALRGKWVQVGLAPNPTVGYVASEIGANGEAGQQGGFARQEFVMAHKLQRNRDIVCAEISAAEQRLAITIKRVQTDVRLRYYKALLAQQRVILSRDLVKIAAEAAQTSQALIEAQEIPLAGLLQTEMQLQNAKLLQRTSENGLEQARRQLQTIVGGAGLPQQTLEGDISQLPTVLDFEGQLAQVQMASPELSTAMAEVTRSRRVLSRACVEAVPNINAQVSVQYDNDLDETVTGVQVGIPLPLWNRNQGGIRKARAEISAAARNVDRVELDLQRRLVDAFRQYSDAKTTAETYDAEILTRSARTLDLIRQGYAQGEVGYLDLLTAQRTFSETNLAYLDALGSLWQSYLQIEGLLLTGSIETNIQ